LPSFELSETYVWQGIELNEEDHPMGEAKFLEKPLAMAIEEALVAQSSAWSEGRIATAGGRFQVRWDDKGSASALGQLVFFAEFLEITGPFERWVAGCPLFYRSPNSPQVQDILGTWFLSILDGQWRYAHITGLRGDAVSPQILGMTRILSDESLRRALKHLAPSPDQAKTEEERARREAQLARSTAWMDEALRESVGEALITGWILDCDTTIKLLYGHQAGALVGYNPVKPGRPSHALHTYWIANVRLVLDAEVQEGTATAAKYSLPRLVALIQSLPPEKRPRLVRGDNAFGNEPVMGELESIDQPYLFKLRQTRGVKQLIERHWSSQDWQEVGEGFQAVETELTLSTWSRARRVVVLRRSVKDEIALESGKGQRARRQPQASLPFAEPLEPARVWEYSVLVTNAEYDLEAIGQLYRDRADCENGFDELKNQWGWGGYTTRDMERCNLSARAVALIYNWWSWYVRLAHPKTRLEAITSRPLLLSGIARMTQHAGQSRLLLTLTHAAGHQIKSMLANVRKGLDTILATAPHLTKPERWKALVRYIVQKILEAAPNPRPTPRSFPSQVQHLLTG
jgi:hypothetical protein